MSAASKGSMNPRVALKVLHDYVDRSAFASVEQFEHARAAKDALRYLANWGCPPQNKTDK